MDDTKDMIFLGALNSATAEADTNKERVARIVRGVTLSCGLACSLLVTGCVDSYPVEAASEPDPDLVFVRGYRSADDVCQLTGETSFTVEFLDDAADLVTCPTGHSAALSLVAETNATVVTQTNSFTLFSIPRR